jgi:uncharacterized protein (DUF433 family)
MGDHWPPDGAFFDLIKVPPVAARACIVVRCVLEVRANSEDNVAMSTATKYPHLTKDDDGTPRIGATRYKVIQLAAEHFHHGWTAEELLRQHPDLRPEEVYAALTYFYDHRDAMIGEMKASFHAQEARRPPQPLSREELLRRSAAKDRLT